MNGIDPTMRSLALTASVLASACSASPPPAPTKVAEPGFAVAMDSLATQLVGPMPAARRPRIAVLEPEPLSGSPTSYERLLAEELTTRLFATRRVDIVERAMLRRVLDEHNLASSPVMDPSAAELLGKLTGAEYVIVGRTTDLGDSISINLRALDTATALVVATGTVTLPKRALDPAGIAATPRRASAAPAAPAVPSTVAASSAPASSTDATGDRPILHLKLEERAVAGQHPGVIWIHDGPAPRGSSNMQHTVSRWDLGGRARVDIAKLCVAVVEPATALQVDLIDPVMLGRKRVLLDGGHIAAHGGVPTGCQRHQGTLTMSVAKRYTNAGDFGMCCVEYSTPLAVAVDDRFMATVASPTDAGQGPGTARSFAGACFELHHDVSFTADDGFAVQLRSKLAGTHELKLERARAEDGVWSELHDLGSKLQTVVLPAVGHSAGEARRLCIAVLRERGMSRAEFVLVAMKLQGRSRAAEQDLFAQIRYAFVFPEGVGEVTRRSDGYHVRIAVP